MACGFAGDLGLGARGPQRGAAADAALPGRADAVGAGARGVLPPRRRPDNGAGAARRVRGQQRGDCGRGAPLRLHAARPQARGGHDVRAALHASRARRPPEPRDPLDALRGGQAPAAPAQPQGHARGVLRPLPGLRHHCLRDSRADPRAGFRKRGCPRGLRRCVGAFCLADARVRG
eukprot:3391841-Rhodomonas_salina.1